ncbi:MAG: BrnA antitoxin family protein [Gammaproteobacteria bacterium]
MNKRSTPKPSQTDWKRVDALRDKDIDFSDNPELSPEEFARAVVRKGLEPVRGKRQLTLRLDADVLEWFKSQGRGYQTRINALLRAYMEAHRSENS